MLKILSALAVGLALVYPVCVYFGLDRLGVRRIGLLVLGLALLRFLASRFGRRAGESPRFISTLWPLAVLGLLAAMIGDERLLLMLPTVVSLSLGLAFLGSLQSSPGSIVERLAHLHHGVPALPPRVTAYCRRVSTYWAVFLMVNATIAAGLALWGSLESWTLYTGLYSYGLILASIAFEYGYRTWKIKPVMRAYKAGLNAQDHQSSAS